MQLEESRYIVIVLNVKIVHGCARFRWFVAAPYFGLTQCPDPYLMVARGGFWAVIFYREGLERAYFYLWINSFV
jgi:hypothetical protein